MVELFGGGDVFENVVPRALSLLIWALRSSHDMVDQGVALDHNVVGLAMWEPPIPHTATGGRPWRYYTALARLAVVFAWLLLRGGFVLSWRVFLFVFYLSHHRQRFGAHAYNLVAVASDPSWEKHGIASQVRDLYSRPQWDESRPSLFTLTLLPLASCSVFLFRALYVRALHS